MKRTRHGIIRVATIEDAVQDQFVACDAESDQLAARALGLGECSPIQPAHQHDGVLIVSVDDKDLFVHGRCFLRAAVLRRCGGNRCGGAGSKRVHAGRAPVIDGSAA